MAKEGVLPAVTDVFCAAGSALLDATAMADNYTTRAEGSHGT